MAKKKIPKHILGLYGFGSILTPATIYSVINEEVQKSKIENKDNIDQIRREIMAKTINDLEKEINSLKVNELDNRNEIQNLKNTIQTLKLQFKIYHP